MAEQILRIKPADVVKLIKKGDMEVVTPSPAPEPLITGDRQIERAKSLFGKDFLGVEAIHTMEEKCKMAGINVSFEIPQLDTATIGTQLSDAVLEAAKEMANDKERFVVLRPEFMIAHGERKPVNLTNLRDLFIADAEEDKGGYSNNPFGDGDVFYDQDWYDDEKFAKEPMKPGFGLPTKGVVEESRDKNWEDQGKLLETGERRREAVETAWDTLLYYAATGKKLLEEDWDWGNSRASGGYLVNVGGFDSDGLYVRNWNPGRSRSDIGVCPSR